MTEQQKANTVIGRLAQVYEQLYLDPDTDSIERYKDVILRGEPVEEKTLSGYHLDERDREETLETPAGPIRTVTIFNRSDYDRIMRNIMAAKDGPEKKIPKSQGGSTLMVFNWQRINEHKKQFFEESLREGIEVPDWNEEFHRFCSVKENYIDTLIILSVGPYSNISAESAGYGEAEWLELSDTIRKNHEMTHVICRKLYPEKIDAIWDELAADAIGLYAAFGRYDLALAKKFLGISGTCYTGGRLENYLEDPESICPKVCVAMEGIERLIEENKGADIYQMIAALEEGMEKLW